MKDVFEGLGTVDADLGHVDQYSINRPVISFMYRHMQRRVFNDSVPLTQFQALN